MDERVQFVADSLHGTVPFAELCRRYGISRPTGYELMRRYHAEGPSGLTPRSRCPHTHPQATPPELVQAIVATRRKHPDWGPVTIVERLRLSAPDRAWPAASTAGAMLKAHGLITPRRRRPPRVVSPRPTTAMDVPNAVWTIDFKGEFRTGDRAWCYPLTVMDGCSRYLLACRALAAPRTEPTRAVLEAVFREFGLPRRIRSDNGVPFAGPTTLARLSRLSVWWIRLGIIPERTQPGCPAQNGRHYKAGSWEPGRSMPLTISYDELLRYTNEEREKWRGWFSAHPRAMEAAVQPGGRLPTVGKLIDHIFLVERRHLQRLTGDPLSTETGLSGSNAQPLFDYGASVRRELEQLIETLGEEAADGIRSFEVRDRQWPMTPRKLLFHILLHETRHWAQIALAVRLAGFEPPGDHDLFFSNALR